MELIQTEYEQKKKIANDHTIFKTLVGSRLYGTNNEDSDFDMKGVAIPPINYYFGFSQFEQFEDRDVDNVIYNFNKAIYLMAKNNPNMLDMLFAPKDFWISCHPSWNIIYDNRYMFLSKEIKRTFCCYANSQLKRMNSHKSWLISPPIKPEPPKYGSDSIYSKAILSIPENLLVPDIHTHLKEYKAYQKQLNEYNDYQSHIKKRNPERLKHEIKVGYDTKHAMHVIRLLRQAKEIFETGEVNVNRIGIDSEELKDIRNGKWEYQDIINHSNIITSKIESLYNTSQLPDTPDINKIEGLVVDTIRSYYNEY